VPPHKGCKRGVVAPADDALQKLPIGQPRPVLQERSPAELLDDLTHWTCRHQTALQSDVTSPLPFYYLLDTEFMRDFLQNMSLSKVFLKRKQGFMC
jgi:hypothetical protein